MTKRMKMLLVFVMLFLLLSGCGESEKVISGTVNNANNGNSIGKTENKEEADQSLNEEREDGGKSQDSKDLNGFIFVSGDVKIAMDEEAQTIVEALGEPKSYFEAASCAFEGLDKIYTYSGFEINTYPLEDKDYISSVILKDDTVTTPEGLAIGDSKEKIEELYGADRTEDNNLIVYEKDDMKLRIILKEEYVAAIEYVSNVLE